MRFLSFLSSFMLAGAAVAQSPTPSSSGGATGCTPASTDTKVVKLAWDLQNLLERYYASSPASPSILSSLPSASSADYSANLRGVQQQTHLGSRAIQQLGAKVPGFTTPRCNFTLPKPSDGQSYLKYAAQLEYDVSGAFIGLAGYTQKPEISFLMARLAASHASQATWLGSKVSNDFFLPNSTALIGAYSPDWVAKAGNKPGMLGRYLGTCAQIPSGPCDKALLIGPLGANLTSPAASSSAFASFSTSLLYGSSGVGGIGGSIFSSAPPASITVSASATP